MSTQDLLLSTSKIKKKMQQDFIIFHFKFNAKFYLDFSLENKSHD